MLTHFAPLLTLCLQKLQNQPLFPMRQPFSLAIDIAEDIDTALFTQLYVAPHLSQEKYTLYAISLTDLITHIRSIEATIFAPFVIETIVARWFSFKQCEIFAV